MLPDKMILFQSTQKLDSAYFLTIKKKVKVKSLSRVQLFATPWTVACQAPLSIGFSRQGYRSGWPHPPPGDLPNPGIKPGSHMSPALTGRFFTTSATCEGLSKELFEL